MRSLDGWVGHARRPGRGSGRPSSGCRQLAETEFTARPAVPPRDTAAAGGRPRRRSGTTPAGGGTRVAPGTGVSRRAASTRGRARSAGREARRPSCRPCRLYGNVPIRAIMGPLGLCPLGLRCTAPLVRCARRGAHKQSRARDARLPREGGESVTRTRCASRSESRSRSVAASSVRHGWFTPIAATAPSWPLRSMRGSLSQTAAEATKRTRSPIAPGSVRLPGGG